MFKVVALSLALAAPLAANTGTPVITVDPAVAASKAEVVNWKVDVVHSELHFSIRHLISRVGGTFNDWSGTITADPNDWSNASVNIVIKTASINTKVEPRDNHLRTADFFDAEKFPEITFKSTSIKRNENEIVLAGDLTMRGVTKPIVLKGRFNGIVVGDKGKKRAGFSVTTSIDRTDFGVSYNRVMEGAGIALGDEVKITINLAADEV